MRRFIAALLLWTACVLPSYAQDDDSVDRAVVHADTSKAETVSATATVRYDSSSVVVRQPPAAVVARFKDDEAFNYGRGYKDPDGIGDRIRRWLMRLLKSMFGNGAAETVWDILIYVIVGGVVVYVVIKLIGADARSLFGKSEEVVMPAGYEENVYGIDYAAQISRALADDDFRLAVRLHFLRLLRDLSDAGAIAWLRNKTDHDYILELSGTPLQAGFERAALMFEYVWYGDFPVDRESYQRIAATIDRVSPSVPHAVVDAEAR